MTKTGMKLYEIDNIKYADLALLRIEICRFTDYNKSVR